MALTIVPDEFTLVLYGADDVRAVFDEVAGLLGLPADVAHAVAAWRPCTNCVVRRALRAG